MADAGTTGQAVQSVRQGAVGQRAVGQGALRPVVDRSPSRVAQEFEGVFAGQITKLMLESVEQGDEFSGGHGEEMFRGLLAEQIGNQIARGSGLGIASAVEAQIIRLQGGVPAAMPGATERTDGGVPRGD